MAKLTIAGTNDYFTRDQKRFFYFADTVWSSFTNATLDEWAYYLDFRRAQGFNALQISILPILHDRTMFDQQIFPFQANRDGLWDFSRINDAFFDKAVTMLEMAKERGFVPALVLLWANYVRDTRFSDLYPDSIMTPAEIQHYTEYVVKRFKAFEPIYMISGDTNFGSEKTVEDYQVALETVKRLNPEGLTVFHLQPSSDLHDDFVRSDLVDFYMYQSGHDIDMQKNCYVQAQSFYEKSVKRPVVNGEPCYDGHGYGHRYGRFNRYDVRKAAWQSLLAGAKAGIAYGAHGIWSWHRKGGTFNNETFSGTPYDWRSALQLDGAWDVAYAKWIYEQYNLFEIVPRNDLLKNDTDEIRVAATPGVDTIVIYVPYNQEVTLKLDLSGYRLFAIELEDRKVIIPDLESEKLSSTIRMIDHNSDVLYVAQQNETC